MGKKTKVSDNLPAKEDKKADVKKKLKVDHAAGTKKKGKKASAPIAGGKNDIDAIFAMAKHISKDDDPVAEDASTEDVDDMIGESLVGYLPAEPCERSHVCSSTWIY